MDIYTTGRLRKLFHEIHGNDRPAATLHFGYTYTHNRRGWYYIVFGEVGAFWLGKNTQEAIESLNEWRQMHEAML